MAAFNQTASEVLVANNAIIISKQINLKNMTKIRIPFREPISARYLYIDPKNNRVHVLVPLVSGTEIGLDNTCKAVYALQEFFGKSLDAKAVSILSSLRSYQEALQFDIGLLGEDSALMEEKTLRLEQVERYIIVN